MTTANPLKELMYPQSIAIWGASSKPMKMGTIQLTNILETGYRGKVYPIHPEEKEILGLPAYRSIHDVKERVDLAMLALPTHAVPAVLEECGRAGVKRAIVISGGFKELASEEGRAQESRIVEIARRYGIRFIGPNCLGILNGNISLNTTTIPLPPLGGAIALASQSGAYTAMIYPLLKNQGARLCQTISVGNEADIDLVDCIDFFRGEKEVKAIGLYIETIRRPREFVTAARKTAKIKPIVAIYVGGTEAGSRSSLSHTGAITGPDEVYQGILHQSGIIRAEDIDEMIDHLIALSCQPLPASNRVAIISNSGGPGTSLAYHVEKAGLSAPLFSPGLQRRLKEMTNPLACIANPIDLTFDTNVFVFKELLETLFASREVDGAVLYGIFGADFFVNLEKRFESIQEMARQVREFSPHFLRSLAEVPLNHGKPLIVMSFLDQSSHAIAELNLNNIPVYPSARRCARSMHALWQYSLIRKWLEAAH